MPANVMFADAHISVTEYVQRFATKEAVDAADGEEEEADEEMSDIGSISDDEEQPADD